MTGNEAARAAERHQPDLVLLDVMLPDVDGFVVLRRIREAASLARLAAPPRPPWSLGGRGCQPWAVVELSRRPGGGLWARRGRGHRRVGRGLGTCHGRWAVGGASAGRL